jgi:hypothetical protein
MSIFNQHPEQQPVLQPRDGAGHPPPPGQVNDPPQHQKHQHQQQQYPN